MTELRKLQKIRDAADMALARPWYVDTSGPTCIRRSSAEDGLGAENPWVAEANLHDASYIVEACNAAVDMSRQLQEAYRLLDELRGCECGDVPNCDACRLMADIEYRFDEDTGEGAGS